MSRVIFTVTDEMKADLDKAAKNRGASLSGLMRLYIAAALSKETGKPAELYYVEPGGPRSDEQPTPLERVRAGLEDIKAGRVVKFETAEDLLAGDDE